jgi:hypothetical protein
MNFLFLAFHYPPSQAIGARRPFHFVKYLRRLGHRVEVVTTTPQPVAVAGVHYVPDPASPLRKTSLAGIAHMTLRKFFFPFEDSVICSYNMYRRAEAILRDSPREWSVFSTFPPVSTHLAALRLRQKYPVRWIADFRDPYAQAPTRRNALRELPHHFCHFSPAVDQCIENRIVRWADLLLANTDVVAGVWRERYPQAAHKIAHLWNGFDEDETIQAEPIPPRAFQVMSHTGGMYHGRNPGLILDSLTRLIDRGLLDPARFRLRFIGEMNYDSIPDQAVFDGLVDKGCVEATGQIPSKEILWNSDFHLLLDWKEGLQVPAKLFEYIRVGRPVLAITSQDSPSARILRQSGTPHLILSDGTPPAEVDERFLAFLRMSTDPVAPNSWFQEQFDGSRRVSAFLELLASGRPPLS